MLKIFITYVNDYISGPTRGEAHFKLMHSIEMNTGSLEQSEVQQLLSQAWGFVKGYEATWFWKRPSFVAQEIGRAVKIFNGEK